MIIYKITNTINGKLYIGQTVNTLHHRWKQHCRSSGCRYLSSSIKKHGKENFTIEEIDRADNIEELNKRESYWIEFYNSTNSKFGYNLESGGRNKLLAEETKLLISKANKGKIRSPEARKKLSDYHKNLPKEVQEKFTKCNIGRKKPCTEERKRKLSIAKTGKPRPEEMKQKLSIMNRAKARLDPMLGISKSHNSFKIQIHGVYVGCYKTLEAAIEKRDEYLKKLDNPEQL
jgi:group I intron endonuclease